MGRHKKQPQNETISKPPSPPTQLQNIVLIMAMLHNIKYPGHSPEICVEYAKDFISRANLFHESQLSFDNFKASRK